MSNPKAARRIVKAMEREILRQIATGILRSGVGFADQDGNMQISGILNLAALANVAEDAITTAFKI